MPRWGNRLGAWLGAVAVAVGCYLPHHLTTDIVHAVGHLQAAHEHPDGDGHSQHHDRGHHHHDACAICVSLSTAHAATTLPAPVALAPPRREAATHLSLAAKTIPSRAHAHTPYAPRAPPSSA